LIESQVVLIALTEEFGWFVWGAFDAAGFNQSACLKGKGSATKSRTFPFGHDDLAKTTPGNKDGLKCMVEMY
jgi:hypothetical protein